MVIEYSVKPLEYAYRFSDCEKKIIAKALVPELKKLQKKIDKIKNNPKNEGQSTYLQKIDDIRDEIDSIQDIIKEFTN